MAGVVLLLLLALMPGLPAAVVELGDLRWIEGELVSQDDQLVQVRSGVTLHRLPRRMVQAIYPDRAAAENARSTSVAWRMREPYPTISVTLDEQVEALVQQQVDAKGQPVDPLLPPPEAIRAWLHGPSLVPADGQPHRLALPWATAKDERAEIRLAVPTGYDPKLRSWPLIIALHGTEDHPGNIAQVMTGAVGQGCLLIAPRTSRPDRFWQSPEETARLLRILGWVAASYRLHPRRIVLCGGSGGGMGTWGIVGMHPELFCLGGSFSGLPAVRVADAPRFRGVPFYMLHGDHDHIPIAPVRALAAEFTRLGLEHVFKEYQGDHYPPDRERFIFRDWLSRAPLKAGISPRPALLLLMRGWKDDQVLPPPALKDGGAKPPKG